MKKNHPTSNSTVSGSQPLSLPQIPRHCFLIACSLLLSAGLLSAQPTIKSLYPPVLTDRAGDHVAYTVLATPSSGTNSYAWYQTGSPATVLSTNNSLVLTNISSANAGTYYVVVTDSNGPTTSANVTLNVINTSYLTLVPSNLVVARIGDGSQALSAKTGNTIYFDQYTTNGTYVNSIQVPDEATGSHYNTGSTNSVGTSPALLVEGAGTDAPLEAQITLSGINQQYLSFSGYCAAYPYSGTNNVNNGATGGSFWRGLATINAYGIYSLMYTNSGFESGGNALMHAMVTPDGTNFYITGEAGSAGVKFVNSTDTSYANGSGIPTGTGVSGNSFVSDTGGESIQVIYGAVASFGYSSASNLVYAETGATNENGLYAAKGVPTSPATNSITFSSLLYTGNGPSTPAMPLDFAFSPDNRRIYVADARPFTVTNDQYTSGGIQCWISNSAGGYNYQYTIQPMTGLTNGAQTIAVDFSASSNWSTNVFGANLYVTTYGLTTNSLVKITDNGPGSTPTVLLTAGTNEALRGIRFSPNAVPPSILSGPNNQTNSTGSNVTFSVKAGGSAPFFYQWYFASGGITNLLTGATNSSFTTNSISLASAGAYSVVVSNLTTLTARAAASLVVTSGAPGSISISHVSGNVVLNWSGSFTLQSSTNVSGTNGGFSDVAGPMLTGPYTNTPSGTSVFYRLRN